MPRLSWAGASQAPDALWSRVAAYARFREEALLWWRDEQALPGCRSREPTDAELRRDFQRQMLAKSTVAANTSFLGCVSRAPLGPRCPLVSQSVARRWCKQRRELTSLKVPESRFATFNEFRRIVSKTSPIGCTFRAVADYYQKLLDANPCDSLARFSGRTRRGQKVDGIASHSLQNVVMGAHAVLHLMDLSVEFAVGLLAIGASRLRRVANAAGADSCVGAQTVPRSWTCRGRNRRSCFRVLRASASRT